MARGVDRYLAGVVVAVGLGVLAACSGGGFFAEREPWRKEAEARCIGSGAVHEGTGVVRINSINGPGMCGADYPFRISVFGQPGSLAFDDEFRPPASIPSRASPASPRWPIAAPEDTESRAAPRPQIDSRPLPPPEGRRMDPADAPISLDPPRRQPDASLDIYDYRRPYGGPPKSEPPPRRAPQAEPPPTRTPVRERQRAQPLGPSRGPRVVATGTVALTPTATLACPLVAAVDGWIASSVQPAAMHWFGAPVVEIRQISAYSCRGMNGNPRARISEHAFGNALDIASFTLADGRKITVQRGWHGTPEEQGFLRDVQGAACDRFSTVLAPGSNAFHYNHMHVDLMHRRNGYRACNPRAVSGEEVAARVRARYARQGRDPHVTGSIRKGKGAGTRSLPPNAFTVEGKVGHQLPIAVPGED